MTRIRIVPTRDELFDRWLHGEITLSTWARLMNYWYPLPANTPTTYKRAA